MTTMALGLATPILTRTQDGPDWLATGTIEDVAQTAPSTPSGDGTVPEYHGPHHDIAGLVVEPHVPSTHVPIWIGGRTRRSLRRAIEQADGWTPFALSLGEVADTLAWDRTRDDWERRDTPLDVMMSVSVDPLGATDAMHRKLDAASAAGVTHVAAAVPADSPAHYVEQLDALAQIAR